MIICSREGCEIAFSKKTHNQKYCCDECCRLATNSRMMEKYYEKIDRLSNKKRLCRSCEVTRLSRYNESNICAACKNQKKVDANNAVSSMLRNASLV